jgi:hypothetical protein
MNRRRNRAVKKRIIRGDGNRRSAEASSGVPDELLSQFLLMAASVVDGAGSFQAAVDQELIGGPPEMLEEMRRCLPKFLGGDVDGPNVRQDWAGVVEDSREYLAERRGGSDVV